MINLKSQKLPPATHTWSSMRHCVVSAQILKYKKCPWRFFNLFYFYLLFILLTLAVTIWSDLGSIYIFLLILFIHQVSWFFLVFMGHVWQCRDAFGAGVNSGLLHTSWCSSLFSFIFVFLPWGIASFLHLECFWGWAYTLVASWWFWWDDHDQKEIPPCFHLSCYGHVFLWRPNLCLNLTIIWIFKSLLIMSSQRALHNEAIELL